MKQPITLLFLLLLLPRTVNAQDFEAPAPGARPEAAASLLEHGLPSSQARWSVGGFSVVRHSIAEFTTRAIAASAGWRVLRVAAGLSQTGDPEIGWTCSGAALGVAGLRAGIGLRAAVRRDRWWLAEQTPLGAGIGAEAGMGAWVRPTEHVDLWASAPQVWLRGSPPPLERGLQVGVQLRGPGFWGWAEQEMRPPGAAPASVHRVGVGLTAGAARLWSSVRDSPLRATVGVSSAISWLEVAAEAESHPVLGETLRLAVQLHSGRAAR